MLISKTSYYYKPKKKLADDEIKAYLKGLSEAHKRWGFDKMKQKSKLDGKPWNHKRLYRIYCELKLNIRVKPRKRLPSGYAKPLIYPIKSNICWSIDFMTDVLVSDQKFRTLNVIDDFNREGLMIEPAYSLKSEVVTDLLDKIIKSKGKPHIIRSDNGPEFQASHFKKWAKKNGIKLLFIQPGKPAQNGFIERFNRSYREEILDMNLFYSLPEVAAITRLWLNEYNNVRPHHSLQGLTPKLFAKTKNINR